MPYRKARRGFSKRGPKRFKRTKRFTKRKPKRSAIKSNLGSFTTSLSSYNTKVSRNIGTLNAAVLPQRLRANCTHYENWYIGGDPVLTIDEYSYRLNSIYDPNAQSGGQQTSANGYSQLVALSYGNYRVDYCTVDIQFYISDNAPVGDSATSFAVGFYTGPDNVEVQYSQPKDLLTWDKKDRRYKDYHLLYRSATGYPNASAGFQQMGRNSGHFRRTFSMKEMYYRYGDADNQTLEIVSPTFMSSVISSNPRMGFQIVLFGVSLLNENILDALPFINYNIKMTYHVEAYNPARAFGTTTDVPQSSGPTGTYYGATGPHGITYTGVNRVNSDYPT